MTRSHATEAIVLKNSRIGEIHKGVVLLTADEGLVRAIAHGAYSQKGKLRGTTNLFCCGTCYLYTDPTRESTRITDFDVREYHPGIREDLARFYTASLWAESVLKTYATGGDAGRLYELFVTALDELQGRDPGEAPLVSIHFVWRFLEYSGLQPDLRHCVVCGEHLAESQPIYFSAREGGFCASEHAVDEMPVWQPGAAAYLRHAGRLALRDALRIVPPAASIPRIRRVLYEILEHHVDSPLNALRTGAGILS